MMIRRLLLLLATTTLLAACARKEIPPFKGEPVTLTFACMDYQRSLYEPLAEGFHAANPDIRVQLVSADSVAESVAWQEQIERADLPAYLATLVCGDTAILRLRWEIRWLAYAYPWLDGAFQATVEGADAELALAAAQARAEELWACLEAGQGFTDNERLRACARQVDPNYPL